MTASPGSVLSAIFTPGTDAAQPPLIGIVDDDASIGSLAEELCRELGLGSAVFSEPSPFLKAFETIPPRAAVLDWRLERELGSAVYMAVRHRFPDLPVVCWTGTPAAFLPSMLLNDPLTRVVDKAAGMDAFQEALRWATGTADSPLEGGTDGHLPHSP